MKELILGTHQGEFNSKNDCFLDVWQAEKTWNDKKPCTQARFEPTTSCLQCVSYKSWCDYLDFSRLLGSHQPISIDLDRPRKIGLAISTIKDFFGSPIPTFVISPNAALLLRWLILAKWCKFLPVRVSDGSLDVLAVLHHPAGVDVGRLPALKHLGL